MSAVPSVRVEWGEAGLRALAPLVDQVVIVDVLSFSTAVAVATERGAEVVPWDPDEATPTGVRVAGPRALGGLSLSPASLRAIEPGTRLVLPSPNGSRLLQLARRLGCRVRTGCLRDRQQVAAWVDSTVGVIAAGERWPDGSVRFALEDWLGAGSIVQLLPGARSVEAVAAVAAYRTVRDKLLETLLATPSGQELVERGFTLDVELAAGGPSA